MVASGSPTPLTWWALSARSACQPTRVRTLEQSNMLLILVAERASGRPGGPGAAVIYCVSSKSVLLQCVKMELARTMVLSHSRLDVRFALSRDADEDSPVGPS